MKPVITLFLGLSIHLVAGAQSRTLNLGGTADKNYYAEIPYETVRNKIFVTVELGGRKHRFLFDTGAPMAISDGLATELMAPELDRELMRDAVGNADTIKIVSVKEIKLGNIVFTDIPALKFLPDLFKCWNIEGVVGSNILRGSIVQILPERHVIILTDKRDRLSLQNKNGIPMYTNEDRQSYPHIHVLFGNRVPVDLGFDTGGDEFIALNEASMRDLCQKNVGTIAQRGFGNHMISELGAAPADSIFRIRIPSLTIANAQFENAVIETHKQGMLRLGARLLNYGTVTLDFIHGKFYFDAGKSNNDLSSQQWPFSPTVTNGKLLIGVVWGEMNTRMKPGEQILAIDSVNFPTIDPCTWLGNNYLPDGKNNVTLTIGNENTAPRKIQVAKE